MTGLPPLPSGFTVESIPNVRHGWHVALHGERIGSLYQTRERTYIGYDGDEKMVARGGDLSRVLTELRAVADDESRARDRLDHRQCELIPDDVEIYGDPDTWEF